MNVSPTANERTGYTCFILAGIQPLLKHLHVNIHISFSSYLYPYALKISKSNWNKYAIFLFSYHFGGERATFLTS